MNTVSGCFGQGAPAYDQIDTAAEAAAAVDAIETTPPNTVEPMACALVQMDVCCQTLARHVRLLTWVVVLLAIYIVLKEIK
jgi:hypothetical protein